MARSLAPRIRLTPDEPGLRQRGTSLENTLTESAEFQQWDVTVGGTLPEFLVYRELVKKHKLKPNEDFIFQSSLFGGRNRLGGAVIDFQVGNLLGRVQGEYWHTRTPGQRGADRIQQANLEAQGFIVIDMLEDELIINATRVVALFMQGRETPLAARIST